MANTVSVAVQMDKILDQYSAEVKKVADEAITETAKESRRKLRSTSPRKTGHYSRGWSVKKVRGQNGISEVIVHNKTDYQLTHLLENGHVIRNGKGTYGRTNGIKHIAPVEEWAAEELPREIERRLD